MFAILVILKSIKEEEADHGYSYDLIYLRV